MGDILHRVIDAVGANQHLAYALVFVLSFSESLPVIGSVIPGSTIIVGISVLVASGAVDIWWLLGAAILGAILGDGFSYWLGRRYHETIISLWPLNRYPQLISIGKSTIQKHGGKSVFIARFTPAIRAIVPLMAGILSMPPGRFYFVNIVSAFAWAISHIVPAVIAGASLALAGAVGGRVVALVIALFVILWLILVIVRYVVRKGLPLLGDALLRLWQWARHHDNWVSREVLSLLDPSHHEIKGLLLLIVLLVGSTWAFFGILKDVVTGDPLARADHAVLNAMLGIRTLWGDRIMVAITELGDMTVTGAIVVVVSLWLAARRAWRAVGYWLGGIAFAALFVEVFKLILHLPTPVVLYRGAGTFGLPSNHMAVTATVYGFLALLAGREFKPRARLALASGTALLVALVAFSRLYLGAHWVSGVAAGLSFALAWIAGLGIVYLSHRPRAVGASWLLSLTVVTFALAGTFNGLERFGGDLRGYAVHTAPTIMTAEEWWQGGWATLPVRRIDLAGGLEEPITLQWAGTIEALKEQLIARGWREPPEWTLKSGLAWLQPEPTLDELPVLTRLHNGRPARLILVLLESNGGDHPARLILRLWRSSVEISDGPNGPYHVWLGVVAEQRLYRVGSLLSLGVAVRDENAPQEGFATALAPVRAVHRVMAPDPFGWNGWVLLGHDPAITLP